MKCYLDRDGIINFDYGYVGTLQRFDLIPEITPIIEYLFDLGYEFHIITNQSGLSRNFYSFSDFLDVTGFMLDSFFFANFSVSFCPHLPTDSCRCRKPQIGMFCNQPLSKYDLLIGDKYTDVLAGKNYGISNLFLISSDPLETSQALLLDALVFPTHLDFLMYLIESSAMC